MTNVIPSDATATNETCARILSRLSAVKNDAGSARDSAAHIKTKPVKAADALENLAIVEPVFTDVIFLLYWAPYFTTL